MSNVYYTKDISSKGLLKIYEQLNIELQGKVAVKLSTGEPGGHNFLNPNLIKDLISKVNGTIVECNTAYGGRRSNSVEHWKVFKEHGFMDIAPCDILDEEGSIELHFENSKYLKGINYVGSHLTNYDSMLVLSHFKGHQMGGFGGALKNVAIGVASSKGKAWIHTAGYTTDINELWGHVDNQDGFLTSMAEANTAVSNYFGKENIAYINVANNLSIDCDCDANPAKPEIDDIGIFASLDPVALDKCCYDTIMNLKDEKKESLVNRMLKQNSILTITAAQSLGLGTTDYELIDID